MPCANFTAAEISTLVHEYVHFLQDISTQTGIIYFRFYAELLHLYIYLGQKNDVFELPVDLEKCGVENGFEQSELLSMYLGSEEHVKIHHIDKIVTENEELLEELFDQNIYLKDKPIQQVVIYYDDNKDKCYYFGGCCVRESMAYLIERTAFGCEERKHELPYNACEMICEKLCPELLGQPALIVALCEMALMHCHSGLEFYCLIKHIADNQLNFKNITQLRDYFSEKIDFLYVDYCNDLHNIDNNIDFLFPIDFPYMRKVNEQVKLFLKRGHDRRMQNHLFITDIMLRKKPLFLICKYIYKIAMPLMVDCKSEIYGVTDLQYMPVPMAVLEFLTHPESGCGLRRFGIKCGLSNFEEHICRTQPWLQCTYKNELCPFAAYLRYYKLDDKILLSSNLRITEQEKTLLSCLNRWKR